MDFLTFWPFPPVRFLGHKSGQKVDLSAMPTYLRPPLLSTPTNLLPLTFFLPFPFSRTVKTQRKWYHARTPLLITAKSQKEKKKISFLNFYIYLTKRYTFLLVGRMAGSS